jgi:NDP-sugar pyrophosphorylase family protein
MKAMILAAGMGTRLRPISSKIPKAMMPVLGIPIIELNLLQIRDQGIGEVVINLHHLPVQIIQHLKDGSSMGLKIRYSLEPTILGTAGGIKKMEHLLHDGTFLVVNADTYRSMDVKRLLEHHLEKGSVITMLLEKNPNLAPDRAVWIDDRGFVVRFLDGFIEDMNQGTPTDFLGVQVMEPEVLSHIPQGQPWGIQQVYVRLLSSGMSIGGYLHGGYWRDLGTLEGYRQIHVDALEGRCPLEIPGNPHDPGIWVADGVHMEPEAKLDPPVFLGPHAVIKAKARVGPNTVIGRRCTIERGARVARSILWEGVRVQTNRVLEDMLVGVDFECALP